MGTRLFGCALVAAVLAWSYGACAEEPAEAKEPEGAARTSVVNVAISPEPARPGEGNVVSIVLAPISETRRRWVPVAPSVWTGTKRAFVEAAKASREIASSYGASEDVYKSWALGELRLLPQAVRGGVLEVSELASSLEISCPREVRAGEDITLHVKSTGEMDTTWVVSLIYPDGSRYEVQELSAGKKLPGGEKGRTNVIQFKTFPADAGGLLGVRVERQEYSEDGWTFWVEVRKP